MIVGAAAHHSLRSRMRRNVNRDDAQTISRALYARPGFQRLLDRGLVRCKRITRTSNSGEFFTRVPKGARKGSLPAVRASSMTWSSGRTFPYLHREKIVPAIRRASNGLQSRPRAPVENAPFLVIRQQFALDKIFGRAPQSTAITTGIRLLTRALLMNAARDKSCPVPLSPCDHHGCAITARSNHLFHARFASRRSWPIEHFVNCTSPLATRRALAGSIPQAASSYLFDRIVLIRMV
jgi:hypothetical protein